MCVSTTIYAGSFIFGRWFYEWHLWVVWGKLYYSQHSNSLALIFSHGIFFQQHYSIAPKTKHTNVFDPSDL